MNWGGWNGWRESALTVGTQRVKFLELLITSKLKALYPYYYRLPTLRDQLGDQIALIGTPPRATSTAQPLAAHGAGVVGRWRHG